MNVFCGPMYPGLNVTPTVTASELADPLDDEVPAVIRHWEFSTDPVPPSVKGPSHWPASSLSRLTELALRVYSR